VIKSPGAGIPQLWVAQLHDSRAPPGTPCEVSKDKCLGPRAGISVGEAPLGSELSAGAYGLTSQAAP